jgi:hypothetical protein
MLPPLLDFDLGPEVENNWLLRLVATNDSPAPSPGARPPRLRLVVRQSPIGEPRWSFQLDEGA